MKVPFFHHSLGKPELDAVAEVLAGPLLTTGEWVSRFEQRFAEYLGVKHCLGVTSCTGALHLCLEALGIGPGDEVITTAMTFIATATSVLEAGATPVLVDCERDTGLIDPAAVEAAITPRTKAIIPVHLYGQMADMRALRAIADRNGLALVEDAAHCVEGVRDGAKPGQLGDFACFSFYATKNLTCGEGGALVTNRSDLIDRLRLLRLHGMTKTAADRAREGYQHWDMVLLGWKYNMDNIQAALLLPQLGRIEEKWRERHALLTRYDGLLAGAPGLIRPRTVPYSRHALHLYPVWVVSQPRDEVVAGLHAAGVSCVVNYRAIHLLTYFREKFGYRPGSFPNAEWIGDRTLSLPFYPGMPPEHVDRTAEALTGLLHRQSRAA
jgi:UDP-4-amino-4-deoxy-L-arabinose-oxoglutarate aminotransferase